MTKEIGFDLHFTEKSVQAVSDLGKSFLSYFNLSDCQKLYGLAVDRGLHVRFESEAVRDRVTAKRKT